MQDLGGACLSPPGILHVPVALQGPPVLPTPLPMHGGWVGGGGQGRQLAVVGAARWGGRGDDDGGEMKLVWGQNIFVARPSHQSHVAVPIAGFHFHLPLRRVLFTHAHLRNK